MRDSLLLSTLIHFIAFLGIGSSVELVPADVQIAPSNKPLKVSMNMLEKGTTHKPKPNIQNIENVKKMPSKAKALKQTKKKKVLKEELIEITPPVSPIVQTQNQQLGAQAVQSEKAIWISDADYNRNPLPPYPASAIKRRMQGTVTLKVSVSKSGNAVNVTVDSSSGYSILDSSAKEAVGKWEFTPARLGNELVESSVLVPIEFKIQKR